MGKRRSSLQFSQSVRIIIFILLFVVLFVLYQTVFQAMQQNVTLRRERIKSCRDAFELMQQKTDEQFSGLLQITSVVHEDQYLRRVALREFGIVDVLDAQNEIKKLIASNLLLNQVHYYTRNPQKLYNINGVYELYYCKLFEGISEAEMTELLESVTPGRMTILPSLRSERSVDDAIVAVMPIPYNSTAPYATLLLELSKEKLLRLIVPSALGQDIVYRFYREDGELLWVSRQAELIDQQKTSEEGLDLYTLDGRKYYRFASERYGATRLSYEMYVPEDVIQVGVFTAGQMRLLSIGCIGMLLLLCPILYMWVYQPMRMLIEQLLGTQARDRRGLMHEDYAIAMREIEQMRQSNNSLLWKIDSNMNLVRVSLLRHLIEYGRASDDFLALCRHADLNFQHAHFRLLLMKPSQDTPQSEVSEYAKVCRPGADVYVVKTPEILYALVNADERELKTAMILELVRASGVIGPEESVQYVGSGWTCEMRGLEAEYRASLEKLNRLVFHDMPNMDEEGAPLAPGARSPYPANEILQLQDGAMEHDREKVKEAVIGVQNYLLHENTPANVAVIAANDVLHLLQKHSGVDMSALIASANRKGRTAADVCQVLREDIELIEGAADRKDDTLTEEMMLYISEMLEDPNLSIATVSAHFQLSESAFSHAFKKRTGGTFAKYVTDLKIQRAKSLLICTDLSIEAIADRLNYSSASSFARMFKAETAFTPTQYRRLGERSD